MFRNLFSQRKSLSEVITEYLEAKSDHLSMHTIRDYSLTFSRLQAFFPEDPAFETIDHRKIRAFMTTIPGSKKNHLNAHIALSALWTWCEKEGYAKEHVLRRVDKPKPDLKVIEDFTQEESANICQAAATTGMNQLRNTAVVFLLLDTGIRASELCGITIKDLTPTTVKVFGKGNKQRVVPISEQTYQMIQKYLTATRSKTHRDQPLFFGNETTGAPFTRHSLRNTLIRIGDRAGIPNAHPHKFRHTFATNYLRNGGDIYTLQEILGHTTLDMVKRYLKITEKDLVGTHRIASPVAKWHLFEGVRAVT